MIAQGIANYDGNVAMPRHNELKACVERGNTGISNIEKLVMKVEGGMSVLKWIGSAAVLVIGAGGGIFAWSRLIHH